MLRHNLKTDRNELVAEPIRQVAAGQVWIVSNTDMEGFSTEHKFENMIKTRKWIVLASDSEVALCVPFSTNYDRNASDVFLMTNPKWNMFSETGIKCRQVKLFSIKRFNEEGSYLLGQMSRQGLLDVMTSLMFWIMSGSYTETDMEYIIRAAVDFGKVAKGKVNNPTDAQFFESSYGSGYCGISTAKAEEPFFTASPGDADPFVNKMRIVHKPSTPLIPSTCEQLKPINVSEVDIPTDDDDNETLALDDDVELDPESAVDIDVAEVETEEKHEDDEFAIGDQINICDTLSLGMKWPHAKEKLNDIIYSYICSLIKRGKIYTAIPDTRKDAYRVKYFKDTRIDYIIYVSDRSFQTFIDDLITYGCSTGAFSKIVPTRAGVNDIFLWVKIFTELEIFDRYGGLVKKKCINKEGVKAYGFHLNKLKYRLRKEGITLGHNQ